MAGDVCEGECMQLYASSKKCPTFSGTHLKFAGCSHDNPSQSRPDLGLNDSSRLAYVWTTLVIPA